MFGVTLARLAGRGLRRDLPPLAMALALAGLSVYACEEVDVSDRAKVYGTVTDADGTPLGNVKVEAWLGAESKAGTRSKDADDPKTSENEKGTYNLSGVPTGDLRIRFSADGVATKHYDLTLAEANVRLDAVLVPPSATLKVFVLNPAAGQASPSPVQGARAALSHSNYVLASPAAAPRRAASRLVGTAIATTGADGAATFEGLAEDDGFEVSIAGFDLNNDGESDLEGERRKVDLSKNAALVERTISFLLAKRLANTGSLTVKVYGVDEALANASVTLANVQHNLEISATTDSNGQVAFSGLPTVQGYQIYVKPFDKDGDGTPDFESYLYPVADSDRSGGVLSTFALNTYTDSTLNLRLSRATGFRILTTNIGADRTIGPSESIEIVFTHEVDPLTVDDPNVDFFLAVDADRDNDFECSGDATSSAGECVAFTASLTDPGTKMTIRYVQPWKEGFRYALLLCGLSAADVAGGSSTTAMVGGVRSTSGLGLAGEDCLIAYWVRSTATRSTITDVIIPSLCGTTTSADCDSFSSQVDYNSSVDIQWSTPANVTPSGYRLHAKNNANVPYWVRLQTIRPSGQATNYVLDVSLPSVFNQLPQVGTSPFGKGTQVHFAVVPVSADGWESDISSDDTKWLKVSDQYFAEAPLASSSFSLSFTQQAAPGQDTSKVSSGSTADNQNAGTTGTTATASKTIHVRVSGFAEPMDTGVSPEISGIEEGAGPVTEAVLGGTATYTCSTSGTANPTAVPSFTWSWDPTGTEGVISLSVTAGGNNADDCVLIKLGGGKDASGNVEPAETQSGSLALGSCARDRCFIRLN
ncbi:MAG: carboxypeptidase regulatory-like domain-containing protein [Nitrospirae bacterium]|nr:carboxypeptidase regulatory-like domain-containing protein [Nitrospirota bacterium]